MKFGFWIPTHPGTAPLGLGQQMSVDAVAITALGYEYNSWHTSSSDIARMRNAALERAREHGCDFLMMQDADIYCPTNVSPLITLWEALRETGAAMAGAVCGLRRNIGQTVEANVHPFSQSDGVYPVERIGTGIVMIDIAQVNEVAKDYAGPWFARTYEDERQTKCKVGEDIFFAQVLRGHDRGIVACGNIPTVHVYSCHKTLAYTPGNATAAKTGTATEA